MLRGGGEGPTVARVHHTKLFGFKKNLKSDVFFFFFLIFLLRHR